MAYNGKTNWQFGDTVTETDLNRIEQGIKTLDLDKAGYADLNGAIQAKSVDGAVRVATTANITLSGLQTIDGVALAAGDRVLVKNQTTGSQNGIYVASASTWTRAADADTTAKIAAGIRVYVREGTVCGGKTFDMSNTSAVTLGTTAITFVQSSGAGSATDTVIGSRAISDATAPTGDSGTVTTLFGWLANMIKSITGGATWRTAPPTTLTSAKSHIDATTGIHGATSSAAASTLIQRDASGRAQVAAPSAAADIARKDTVDAAITTAANDATTKANAVQTNLTTHSNLTAASIHGSTDAATASRLVHRDSSGRAKFAGPLADSDAATKGYVDETSMPTPVRVATTANITLSGTQTIDGIAVVAGDRVLVKNQTTGSQNGIYTVASAAWTRANDADTAAKLKSGMLVRVAEGMANGTTSWGLTTTGTITVGTTALTFSQAGAPPDGTTLEFSGKTIRIKDGGITDAKIGNRTINDAIAVGTTDTDTVTNLFSKIGAMIRAVTGKADWHTAPAISLETVNSRLNQAVNTTSSPTFEDINVVTVPKRTTDAFTIWVRPDGNDANTGFANTAAGAKKTIAGAIASIPQMVNNTVTIDIADGTYPEQVWIDGFHGKGGFEIVGNETTPANVKMNGWIVINNRININIKGMTNVSTNNNVYAVRSYVRCVQFNTTVSATANFAFEAAEDAVVTADNCVISNRQAAFRAIGPGSHVYGYNCTGSGNASTIYAQSGGRVDTNGNVPTATGADWIDRGIANRGFGVLNPWGENTRDYRPAARGKVSAIQNFPTGTWTKVAYAFEEYDHLGNYDATLSRFTVPQAGIYQVHAGIGLAPNVSGVEYVLKIFLNNSADRTLNHMRPGSSGAVTIAGSGTIRLLAGDFLEIYLIHQLGSTLPSYQDGTTGFFEVVRIA
ncbi:hypothetical protein [Cohnella thailandensis]|uniref:C1q domain-containing protein n=1 Tax=Cohnella thailandensis TaxID=557557 RepID=A0A841SUL6_9BACL|nr:hypothetical protein [Cohnella thailandensis]MBB6633570.1 hypothetical protein [Cohnella thailandensis]MBP1974588.1 phage-related tail fiber protein [Cohnella thailandensis]